MSKKLKKEIAQKILDCYRGVDWRTQTFCVNGEILKVPGGEKEFYKRKSIDKAHKKLDKLVNSLLNA